MLATFATLTPPLRFAVPFVQPAKAGENGLVEDVANDCNGRPAPVIDIDSILQNDLKWEMLWLQNQEVRYL